MNKQQLVNRRVLGIDCGTAIVGWSVLEYKHNILHHLGFGDIRTDKKNDMSMRLRKIYEELLNIIDLYQPTEMAVEDLFFFKNQKTVIPVGQARGVIMLAGAINNLPVKGYTPLQVKVAVTGYGRAEKKQVISMVTKILKLKEPPHPDDVADAIAIGICHLNSQSTKLNHVG